MPIATSVRRALARLALASSVVALSAPSGCSDRNPLATGVYTAKQPPFAGATLDVAADKASVTITLPGEKAPIKRAATPWPTDKWPQLCPRGIKNTGAEVLDLGPDPLVVGGRTFDKPVVITDCMHKPIVNLTTVESDGRPAWNGVTFEK